MYVCIMYVCVYVRMYILCKNVRKYVCMYVCIPIGDTVTYDQRDRPEYIRDVLRYNTEPISDVPRFLK